MRGRVHIIKSDKREAKAVLALSPEVSLERAKQLVDEEMLGASEAMVETVKVRYRWPDVWYRPRSAPYVFDLERDRGFTLRCFFPAKLFKPVSRGISVGLQQ